VNSTSDDSPGCAYKCRNGCIIPCYILCLKQVLFGIVFKEDTISLQEYKEIQGYQDWVLDSVVYSPATLVE
jgi:hypothetical protein